MTIAVTHRASTEQTDLNYAIRRTSHRFQPTSAPGFTDAGTGQPVAGGRAARGFEHPGDRRDHAQSRSLVADSAVVGWCRFWTAGTTTR